MNSCLFFLYKLSKHRGFYSLSLLHSFSLPFRLVNISYILLIHFVSPGLELALPESRDLFFFFKAGIFNF